MDGKKLAEQLCEKIEEECNLTATVKYLNGHSVLVIGFCGIRIGQNERIKPRVALCAGESWHVTDFIMAGSYNILITPK